MYAIVTKYFGPTDYRGSRIRATSTRKSLFVEYDDGLSSEVNHLRAREALIDTLDANHCYRDLKVRWTVGSLPDGSTVHVPSFPEG